MNLLHHLLLFLRKSHYSLFPKLKFICKIFFLYFYVFLFCLRIRTVYYGKNFLITGINNSQIEQNLGNTRRCDRMFQSNFSLPVNARMQFCIVVMASSVHQFWSFFCYGVFQFIKLIEIFCRIDGFILRKKLIIDYSFPILPNGQKNFLRVKSKR